MAIVNGSASEERRAVLGHRGWVTIGCDGNVTMSATTMNTMVSR